MTTKIKIILSLLLLTSCVTPFRAVELPTRAYTVLGYHILVTEIEGCEYVFMGGAGIIHKENCKNHPEKRLFSIK